MDLLCNTHFPGSLDTPCKDSRTKSFFTINLKDPKAEFINEAKVSAAIQSFQSFKGAGPDTLPPHTFKQFGAMAITRLTRIYKASYLLGYIPKKWLDIRMVFIPKPGKKSYSEPRAYRPISLMNFLLKILEKLLLWHNEEKVLSQCLQATLFLSGGGWLACGGPWVRSGWQATMCFLRSLTDLSQCWH